MNAVFEKLGKIGLVPVIKLDSPEQALTLGKALVAGGIPVAEITFRTDAAEESIKILANELPELLVGAGTVLTTEQADAAAKAGAKYIVTPGFNPKVVARSLELGLPVVPGVSTPSEVEHALEMGLSVVKFFPAEQSGGTSMLKALNGPYAGKISFIPTGGVGPKNLAEYLALPNVFAVGGSWMAPSDAVKAGDFEKIENLCREARILSLGFELKHLGINPDSDCPNIKEAPLFSAIECCILDDAHLFASMLGMPFKEGSSSAFVGESFEFMKQKGLGKNGHIAIATLSIERALEWFAGFGIKPIEEKIKRKDGRITFAYLDKEIAGFAVHLNRK